MLKPQTIRYISLGLALSLALLTAVAFASSAGGLPKPPRATLRDHGRVLQKGNLGSYCWAEPEGGGLCRDEFDHDFPRGVWVRAGASVAIHFHKKEELKDVHVTSWRRVDEDGEPVGDGRGLRHRIEPVKRDGEVVAWKARFTLRRGGRHYYLYVYGKWSEGSAYYDFHAKTRGELTCAGRPVTLTGTSDSDELIGTSADDVIVARGDADAVKGKGGDDRICSGAGPDVVRGGPGADRVLGRDGDDLVYGGRGHDRLRGEEGRDDLRGGPGRDLCSNAEHYRSCELRIARI